MEELYGFVSSSSSTSTSTSTPGFFSSSDHYSSSVAMAPMQQLSDYYRSFEPSSAVIPASGSRSGPMCFGSNPSTVSDCVSVAAAAAGNQRRGEEVSCTAVNAKIASHPLYPNLLQAYIDCQKVSLLVVCVTL